jgi:hypothetical protein
MILSATKNTVVGVFTGILTSPPPQKAAAINKN